MSNSLDQDVRVLKEWLRYAWHSLADPSLTTFERRELRNYMREANSALRHGLNLRVARERSRRQAAAHMPSIQRPSFRILGDRDDQPATVQTAA